jgi:hypothetical protein
MHFFVVWIDFCLGLRGPKKKGLQRFPLPKRVLDQWKGIQKTQNFLFVKREKRRLCNFLFFFSSLPLFLDKIFVFKKIVCWTLDRLKFDRMGTDFS